MIEQRATPPSHAKRARTGRCLDHRCQSRDPGHLCWRASSAQWRPGTSSGANPVGSNFREPHGQTGPAGGSRRKLAAVKCPKYGEEQPGIIRILPASRSTRPYPGVSMIDSFFFHLAVLCAQLPKRSPGSAILNAKRSEAVDQAYLRTRGLPFSRESIGPLPPKRFDAIFKARSGEPVRSP